MQLPYLKKANFFFGIIVIIFVVVIIRLFYLQIYQHKKFDSLQFSQAYLKVDCQPESGMILDRNGEILALSRLVDSVYVVPQELDNHPVEIQKLAATMGIDKESLSAKIKQANEQKKFFLWVKRRIDDETSQKIKDFNIKGVGLKKEYKRFYPKETSACHLIGYRGLDEQALEGLELWANNYLKGEAGYQYLHRDARRRLFTSELPEKPAQPGKNVYLTIDILIQHIVEKNLKELCKKWKPVSAQVLVLRPDTGEILAMAQEPSFDPTNYQKYSVETRRNRIVTEAYEPGSTFKPFVVTSALEKNIFNRQSRFFCENGSYKIGRRTIHDHKPYGWLTLNDVVAQSSNIGMTKVGMATGKNNMYEIVKRFGFCRPSNLGIPSEHPGLMTPLNKWSDYTVTSVSMGYEISVNSLQLARAYATFANGGCIVEPQIIKEIGDRNGNIVYSNNSLVSSKQIISPQLNNQMSAILRTVVTNGTASAAAKLSSYSFAGKTGTARKINPDGKYSTHKYKSLFVAFAPVEKPEILVLVLVDEPKGAYYASTVAAPTAAKIIDETLKYLMVPCRIADVKQVR
ncbi:MAG: penicillin-binding protein 2 [Planctomycetota bacterium]